MRIDYNTTLQKFLDLVIHSVFPRKQRPKKKKKGVAKTKLLVKIVEASFKFFCISNI